MPPLTDTPDSPFARYLFGDFTHPTHGLAAQVWLTESKTNKAQKTYAMHLSKREFGRDGMMPAPLGTDAETIRSSLASRHLLGSDQTLKIMTYQEIVEHLVFDGAVPYELIVQACSGRANIPPAPKAAYASGSTVLPMAGHAVSSPPAGHGAPYGMPATAMMGAPHPTPDNPARLMHVQVQGQVYEVPLGELRNWLSNGGDPSTLVKPADNAHDFMPLASSPVVNPPLALPAQSQALPAPTPAQFGGAQSNAFGAAPSSTNPFAGGAAPGAPAFSAAPATPAYTPAASAPTFGGGAPQVNPFAGGGGAQPVNPFATDAGAAAGAAAAAFAAPQSAQPMAAAMANIAQQATQPAQPQANPFAGGDEIPGIGGNAAPSVAVVTDPQPVPVGVPVSGTVSGPLSPAEQAELQDLINKPQERRTTVDTTRMIELSGRSA